MSTKAKRKNTKKGLSETTLAIIIISVVAVLLVALMVVVLCLPSESSSDYPAFGTVDMTEVKAAIDSHEVSDFSETSNKTEYVKITVKDHGDIVLRLRADVAPITVTNFQKLVADGFYDGLTIHRVMKGFMIQGGDPDGDGSGGSDEEIKGEFSANGVTNNMSHIRGVISMARENGYMDSASSQFFICDADSTYLDGNYAAFGYVMAGMETVDSIASVDVQYKGDELSDPVEDIIIEKIVFVTDNHNH